MTRDEALAKLRALRPQLEALGFRHVWLFGSVARDEAGPGSDVDLLVEVDDGRYEDAWDRALYSYGREGTVSGWLGEKAELIDRAAATRRFTSRIEPDLVSVY